MIDLFKIYVRRLTNERTEPIAFKCDPNSLDLPASDEINFQEKVKVSGSAYLTKEHLILQLKIETEVTLPCKICNEPTNKDIEIKKIYHAEPLANIHNGIYDYREKLRETILLEVPAFLECSAGNCPQRKDVNKHLKGSAKSSRNGQQEEPISYPFKNLYKE